MSKNVKTFIGIGIIAVVVFVVIFLGMRLFNNIGKTSNEITLEDTISDLNRYVDRKVRLEEVENPVKGEVDLEETSLEDELPDIDTYPFKVEGSGDVNIEIFSSPEKAGSETSNEDEKENTWLIEVVKDFNKEG